MHADVPLFNPEFREWDAKGLHDSCLHVDSSFLKKHTPDLPLMWLMRGVRHLGRNPEAPTGNRQ